MSDFRRITSLKRQAKWLGIAAVVLGIAGIGAVGEIFDKASTTNVVGGVAKAVMIWAVAITCFRLRLNRLAVLAGVVAEVNADPDRVGAYHTDEHRNVIERLRNQVRSLHFQIANAERNGEFSIARQLEGEVRNIESQLRQLGA